jgi:hypothetical protein
MKQVDHSLTEALELFGLPLPISQDQLTSKRKELLHTWYPARYANLTNNPKKYMHHYRQAEAMTKKVEAAYALLSAWIKYSDAELPDDQNAM